MRVIYRRDHLTAAEMKAIRERHAPYHNFRAFWVGFTDYQYDCNRKCPYDPDSVMAEAWDRGTEAAMRIHWERHSCMYARDDLDSRVQIATLRRLNERRKNPNAGPANDNRPHADA
jgi:hypothetical protein